MKEIAILIISVILFVSIVSEFLNIRNSIRMCKILKNIKKLTYAGDRYYRTFYFIDKDIFWILQYRKKSSSFSFFKWGEKNYDYNNFFCTCPITPITNIIFYIIIFNLNKIEGYVELEMSDIKEEPVMKSAYREFQTLSKRKKLIRGLN